VLVMSECLKINTYKEDFEFVIGCFIILIENAVCVEVFHFFNL
jgi:hypothetical protein